MSLTTEDRDAIKDIVVGAVVASEQRLVTKIDDTDKKLTAKIEGTDAKLTAKIDRLADKVASNHSIGIQHHLATRAMLAKQGKKYDQWREGLEVAITGKRTT